MRPTTACCAAAALLAGAAAFSPLPAPPTRPRGAVRAALVSADDPEILLKVCRGQDAERTPVWLMRQAGRYMADFRKYSDRLPFRERAETPEIAMELSLQPRRAFGVDGVIVFSDILTPLPALGIDFDVVKGTGPVILNPVRTADDVAKLTPLGDPSVRLPFVGETLRGLRDVTRGECTLVGFVGAPWTLAAYSAEGGATKNGLHIKGMMLQEPETARALLAHLAEAVGDYACHQVESGAQVIQVFESWAHQLSPLMFEAFAKPYAQAVANKVKAMHPDVPVIYYANGGAGYLEQQGTMMEAGGYDMLSLDWHVDARVARDRLGASVRIAGNVDPSILRLGTDLQIRESVAACIDASGGPGTSVLNCGHGVMQQTPERSVQVLVDAAREIRA